MKAKYKAEFTVDGETKFTTRYYETVEEAQDALAKRIGYFPYLGQVSGDVRDSDLGYYDAAPRCGGQVDILEGPATNPWGRAKYPKSFTCE